MALLQRKQLDWINAGWVGISAFEASGGSTLATADITSALLSAGRAGTPVPLQVSVGEGQGVITSGNNNRIEIFDATTQSRLVDVNGDEVYGRITEAAGAYTLTYYVLDAGVETAHTVNPATDIDFYFPYRFSADKYPVDAAITLPMKSGSNAGAGTTNPEFSEQLAVTAVDTVASLTKLPIALSAIKLSVNGQLFSSVETNPAFTVAGNAVSWSSANAGFALAVADRVVAYYSSDE